MLAVTKSKRILAAKTITAFIAIAVSVALPQIFHLIGKASGTGGAVGATLLPMHFAVILAGIIAGPVTGLAAGALSPLFSFAITGMPSEVMLPFMIVELAAYGLTAGLLKNTKLPVVVKVFIAQIAGRLLKALAIGISYYAFDYKVFNLQSVWTATTAGLLGIALQLVLIPLLVYRLKNVENKFYN